MYSIYGTVMLNIPRTIASYGCNHEPESIMKYASVITIAPRASVPYLVNQFVHSSVGGGGLLWAHHSWSFYC